ncbi:MAG: hypothetical protein KBE91_02270 [Bacteroidia bacterium]|nr:hypothetical protein [Bacteroidia bacterium]
MVVNSFEQYMFSINAILFASKQTPFTLYKLEQHNIIIQFIRIEEFKNTAISLNFFTNFAEQFVTQKYKVINIWEDVWKLKPEQVKQRIKSLLGFSQKIHARQTQVVRLNKLQASTFLRLNHLQGDTNAYYKFGLKFNDEIVAVATFSKARTMYDGPVYYRSFELERFANKLGLNVVGGFSKLISNFILTTHAKHIMTYADCDWSTGESYLKLGFNLIEKSPPNIFFLNENTLARVAEKQENKAASFLKIWNAGSLKFVLDKR